MRSDCVSALRFVRLRLRFGSAAFAFLVCAKGTPCIRGNQPQLLCFPFRCRLPFTVCYRLPLVTVYRCLPFTVEEEEDKGGKVEANAPQLLFFPFRYRLPFTVCYRLPLATVYRFLPFTVAYRLQFAAFAMARPGPAGSTVDQQTGPCLPFASVYRLPCPSDICKNSDCGSHIWSAPVRI